MSKTEENLRKGFAGESQARNKYIYFAKVARKEGFHYIAKIFEETAENEVQHAKDQLKLVNGIGNTETNLVDAVKGEEYENSEMYPSFVKDAEEEGDMKAAKLFRNICKVEKEHEKRFRALLDMVKSGTVFKREQEIEWKCSKCGYVHTGKEAPEVCPSCKHPQEYFEPKCMCFDE